MDDDFWFPWKYIRYKRKTAHLSHYQDSCYRRIIDYYIETRRAPMDSDVALARIVGDSVEGWLTHGSAIVRAFFTVRDGFLYNDTCEEILKEQEEFKATRSRAGKTGADNRWKNKKKTQNRSANSEAIADPMAKHATRQDKTIQNLSKEEGLAGAKPCFFEIDQWFPPIWNSYPGRGKDGQRGEGFKGPKAAAKEVFKEIILERKEHHGTLVEGIVAGCIKYAAFLDDTGTPGKHLTNWLRSRGWEDDYSVAAAANRPAAGHSVSRAVELARSDKTHDPEGRKERLAQLGITTGEADEG